jgi:dienelactone hydrolase
MRATHKRPRHRATKVRRHGHQTRRHRRRDRHRRGGRARPRRTGTARDTVARSASAVGSPGVTVPPALNPTSPGAALDTPPPAYPWEGASRSQDVTFRSAATGAMLFGVLFEPAHVSPAQDGRLPAVVITPGSGPGLESQYQWSARDLAGHAYLALTVDPQGVGRSQTFGTAPCTASGCPGVPFQQTGNYEDATTSGIDFLLSRNDPARALLNPNEIGAAGHSLSSRAVSYLQGVDPRIKAIVAWDNLTSNLQGDAGTPSGGGDAGSLIGGELPGPATPVRPRVPALGEASDARGATEPTNGSPDQKKTAYAVWRSAGLPVMETVFNGASHLDWAQTPNNSTSDEASLEAFEYYTRAWFDLYLRHDPAATARLLARTVDGKPLATLLSSQFRSAAFLPAERVDCPDLVARCSPGAPSSPSLSRLRITPSTFRAAGHDASVAASEPRTTGTTISYRDSILATTTFTVDRSAVGVRVGKRCVAQHGRHAKHTKRCVLLVPLGRFTHADKPGANSLHFTGHVSGKTLTPGRYTLLAVASSGGAVDKPVTAHFKVVA